MSPLIQSTARTLFTFLVLLYCFGANVFRVAAQNSEYLSRQPPILKIFDSEKNESTVSALLFDPRRDGFRGTSIYSPNYPPPDIGLFSAEYKYPGKILSRTQTIAFVLTPRNKYKTAPSFSITGDDVLLLQGETTFRELCCAKVDGHTDNRQNIIVAVPIEIVQHIIQARKVELKLNTSRGKYSFKLNDYQKKSITALLDTTK